MTLILILSALSGCVSYHRAEDVPPAAAAVPPPAEPSMYVNQYGLYVPTEYRSAATDELYRKGQELVKDRERRMAELIARQPYPTVAIPGVAPVVCPKDRDPANQAETDACQNDEISDLKKTDGAIIKAVGVDHPKQP